MKIKAGELLQAVDAIRAMSQDKMPLRAASWLAILSKNLTPSYQLVVDGRNSIIRKYCDDGKNSVATERIKEYLSEIEPFLNEEVEIDILKVKMEIFDGVPISPASLVCLDPLFEI